MDRALLAPAARTLPVPPPPPPAPAMAPPAAPASPASTLRGTVTDTAGTKVQDATVTVASNGITIDGQVKTDSQGNWAVAVPRPGQYQVTVQAAGFKTEQAAVDLGAADSQPIQTRLNVGSSAEAVAVAPGASASLQFRQSAEAVAIRQAQSALQQRLALAAPAFAPGGRGGAGHPGARQLYEQAAARSGTGAARVTATKAVTGALQPPAGTPLGVRYSLVPAAAGGGNAESVQIEFSAAADGTLVVTAADGRVLVQARIERLKPFVTPPLKVRERQIAVTYTRGEPATAGKPGTGGKPAFQDLLAAKKAPPVQPVQETVAGVTYVASPGPEAGMTFTIALK